VEPLDYKQPEEMRWLPFRVLLYAIVAPILGTIYIVFCFAFCIGALQYAGAPPGSTPNIDAIFRVIGFPMVTFFEPTGGREIGCFFVNAVIWALVPVSIGHLIWTVAVKLRPSV
jgi:hypothetical protein